MLDLNDFFYFVQVVDRGGFTAAGRTLRVPKSTLSHRIQQLEGDLGVRLLNRTSRRFGMTDAIASAEGDAKELLEKGRNVRAIYNEQLDAEKFSACVLLRRLPLPSDVEFDSSTSVLESRWV